MTKNQIYALHIALIMLLLAGGIAVLTYYSNAAWYNRIGYILQLIGIYGIALGFVQKSDSLKRLDWIADMSSADPVRFSSSNLYFLALIMFLMQVALKPERSPGSSMASGCLGQLLIM